MLRFLLQTSIIEGGARPYVDARYRTRSYIEGRLVEIMERCWAQESEGRPSMFEVVSFLRDVKRNATRVGVLESSTKIKIPR